jgi:hypothetical protein
MTTRARRHRRASPPPLGSRGSRRARRANLRFLQEKENEERFSRAPRVRIPCRRIRMSASQSAIRSLFSFHFIHVRRREAKERRSVAVSSAAHGATLTARRRRQTRDTHRTMFAVHSFATHSSAAAFRPSLRRYAPRRPPPIARATWPTHSTLASVDGPPRTESPRASRRPPRTRLALSRD